MSEGAETLNLTSIIILNGYSIIVLVFILVHALQHAGTNVVQHKLYLALLQVTILMLVVDIFSRFDGNPGTIYQEINHVGNFLIFLLNPLLPSLWLLYAHFQVFHDERVLKSWTYPLLAINGINLMLLIMTQFSGWYYTIDLNNIYHRGSLFWIPVMMSAGLMLVSFMLIVFNRKRIEKKPFIILLLVAVPPFVGIIVQITFYGVSILLNMVALSLLFVFLNVQNQNLNTDYLTGVNNRKKLETVLKTKIKMSTENKSFSAIMIDLDDFKSINDTFGHDVGDDALETSIALIKSCVRPNDFIARYGGDEFYIVLDISKIKDLETTVSRIRNCVESYNESGKKPYKLGFSIGYALYDVHSRMNANEFQQKIDELMYENKRLNQSEQCMVQSDA